MQTPNKQGDDGWKSVLYEGQPLEVYRRRYSGKPRTQQPRRSSACVQDGDEVCAAHLPSSPILLSAHGLQGVLNVWPHPTSVACPDASLSECPHV